MTPDDYKAAGVNMDKLEHKHSSVDSSPLGKKGGMSDEQIMKLRQIAIKKFSTL